MSEGIWKAKVDAMLHTVSRDLGDLWRETGDQLARLDAAERLVAVCLVVIGTVYLLLGHSQRRSSSDGSTVRFAGWMLTAVVLVAGVGWMVSGGTA